MNPVLTYWLMQLVCVAAIAATMYLGLRKLRYARLVEDTPTSSIRSAAQGYVELCGTAKPLPGYPAEPAPLTGLPCLWYHYEIFEEGGKKPVESGTSHRPFLLTDDHGDDCIIHVDDAKVIPKHVDKWGGHQRRPAMAFVAPEAQSRIDTGKRYKYREYRINLNDSLYAIGLFRSFHPPSAEQQAAEQRDLLIMQWKLDQEALIRRFDKDNNGYIDMDEWQQAQDEALRIATEQVRNNFDHSPEHLLTLPPDRKRPLIISSMSQSHLIKKYRRDGWLYFAAALLIVAFWGSKIM